MKKLFTLFALLLLASGLRAQNQGWVQGEALISSASQINSELGWYDNKNNLVDGNENTFCQQAIVSLPEDSPKKSAWTFHLSRPVSDIYFSYFPRKYGNYGSNRQWSDAPHSFTVFVSEDGDAWTEVDAVSAMGGCWPEEWYTSDVISFGTEYEWVKFVFTKNWPNVLNGSDTYRACSKGGVKSADVPYIAMAELQIYEALYTDLQDVTFNIVSAADGTPFGSFKQTMVLGDEVSSMSQIDIPEELQRDFISFDLTPFTVTDETTSVTIPATWNGPFEISASVESAHWYLLRNHDAGNAAGWHYAKYGEPVSLADMQATESEFNSGVSAWAFIGDPYNGLAIVNKSAPAKSLAEAESVVEGEYPEFLDGLHHDWIVGRNLEGGFYIRLKDDATGVIRRRNDVFSYWTASAGTTTAVDKVKYIGQEFKLDCCFQTFEPGAAENYAANVEADILPYFEKVGQLFYISTEANETLGPVLESALSECDAATYTMLYNAVHEASNFQMPVNKAYYRIYANSQYDGNTSCVLYYDRLGADETTERFNAVNIRKDLSNYDDVRRMPGTVFQYTERDNGKSLLKNMNGGVYINNGSVSGGYVPGGKAEFNVILVPVAPGRALIYVGGGDKPADYSNQNRNYLLSNLTAWTANRSSNNNDSWWTFVEAEDILLDLNEATDQAGRTYATLAVSENISVSGNSAAYSLEQDIDDTAILTKINGTVHSEIPVLIINEAGESSVAVKIEPANASTARITPSILQSIVEYNDKYCTFSTETGDLVLQQRADGAVGFFFTPDDQPVKCKPNRAFISAELYDDHKGFNGITIISDESTGIGTVVSSTTAATPVYDLQGRRVAASQLTTDSNLPAGIYVANGKRILKR